MSKLTLSVNLSTYDDTVPSNAPSLQNFKWNRDLNGLSVSDPSSQTATLAPGENRNFFNGIRTLTQDGSAIYDLALAPLSTNTYVLSLLSGTSPNFRTARSIGIDATSGFMVSVNGPVVTFLCSTGTGGTHASQTTTFAGTLTPVTITAVNGGTYGNTIVISTDGTSSFNQLIAAWNANPSNALINVALTAGDGTQVPSVSQSIALSGGTDATGMSTTAIQIGDWVTIGSEFNALNQGSWQIISKTSNSFSVVNESGVNEGPIILGSTFASQVQVYSAAGVQVNDTIVISGGFSPVTQGSYQVTAVTPTTLSFYSTAILPQETNIATDAFVIYSQAKQLIYVEASVETSVIVNGTPVATIEPFVIAGTYGSTTKPGMFLLKSTVYSLALQNNSINSSDIFIATVE